MIAWEDSVFSSKLVPDILIDTACDTVLIEPDISDHNANTFDDNDITLAPQQTRQN